MKKFFGILILTGLMAVTGWAADESSKGLTFLFTGLVRGTYSTCGCVANPNGGLPRRAGFTEKYVRESGDAVVQLDLGNYLAAPGRDAAQINEVMFAGLDRLKVNVVNLAPKDLYQWSEISERDSATHWISTNLSPGQPGVSGPDRFAVIEIEGSRLGMNRNLRIGFLGISDPATVPPRSGFVGSDPVEAVSAALKEMPAVDFVVVLADMQLEAGPFRKDSVVARIAQAHDNIYAVFNTERQYLLRQPAQFNNAILMSSIERGRQVGRLRFEIDSEGKIQGVDHSYEDMNETVTSDPELQGLADRLDSRLGSR